MSVTIPNGWSKPCACCKTRVFKGAGVAHKEDEHATWQTYCHTCFNAPAHTLPDHPGPASYLTRDDILSRGTGWTTKNIRRLGEPHRERSDGTPLWAISTVAGFEALGLHVRPEGCTCRERSTAARASQA